MFKYKHKTSGEAIETANKVTSKNWILVEKKETKTGTPKASTPKKGNSKKDGSKKDAAGKEAEGQ